MPLLHHPDRVGDELLVGLDVALVPLAAQEAAKGETQVALVRLVVHLEELIPSVVTEALVERNRWLPEGTQL